ncbi:MAG TPA: hypothetical protein RMH99_00465 [Sandaracinaceae bacterium LLY-WYZ-13_1]|nr:hypothetical protein [Sandaracinaceae bacterium LLY-WYZ-13_1]
MALTTLAGCDQPASAPSASDADKHRAVYDEVLAIEEGRAVLIKRSDPEGHLVVAIGADGHLDWAPSVPHPLERVSDEWLRGDDLVEVDTGRRVALPPGTGAAVCTADACFVTALSEVVALDLGARAEARWRQSDQPTGAAAVVGDWLVVSGLEEGRHRTHAIGRADGIVHVLPTDGRWVAHDDETIFVVEDGALRRLSLPTGREVGRLDLGSPDDPRATTRPLGEVDGATLWFTSSDEQASVLAWQEGEARPRWRVRVPTGDVAPDAHRAVRSPLSVPRSDEPALPPVACWAIGRELPSSHDIHRTRVTCVDVGSGTLTWSSSELMAEPRVRHDAEGTLVTLRLGAEMAAAIRFEREPVRALDLGESHFDAAGGTLWLVSGSRWQPLDATLDDVPTTTQMTAPEEALRRFTVREGG